MARYVAGGGAWLDLSKPCCFRLLVSVHVVRVSVLAASNTLQWVCVCVDVVVSAFLHCGLALSCCCLRRTDYETVELKPTPVLYNCRSC